MGRSIELVGWDSRDFPAIGQFRCGGIVGIAAVGICATDSPCRLIPHVSQKLRIDEKTLTYQLSSALPVRMAHMPPRNLSLLPDGYLDLDAPSLTYGWMVTYRDDVAASEYIFTSCRKHTSRSFRDWEICSI